MTPATQEPKLALYPIIQTLFDLYLERMDVEEDTTVDAQDREASLRAIEISIGEYFTRLEDKVDGIAYVSNELETRATVKKIEGQRLLVEAKRLERAQEDLENRIAKVMQATGQKRLEGALKTLRMIRNPPSVEVRQPEMVPSKYKRVVLKIDLETLEAILAQLATTENKIAQSWYLKLKEWKLDPDLENGVMRCLILPVLKTVEQCDACKGTGKWREGSDGTCDACKGTGKVAARVAGCALDTERVRLEIK